MTIAVGTPCFLVGITGKCMPPLTPAIAGHVVEVASPLLASDQAVGGFAYRVTAAWLPAERDCYVVPACLLPIVPPARDSSEQPEAQQA